MTHRTSRTGALRMAIARAAHELTRGALNGDSGLCKRCRVGRFEDAGFVFAVTA